MSHKMDQKFNYSVQCSIKTFGNKFDEKELNLNWKPPRRQLAFIKAEHQITNSNLNDEKILLIGLHTCGDLAPIILHNFATNSNAQILVNVGCCYHKLNNGKDKPFRNIYPNRKSESKFFNGYPLSKKFSKIKLSYASRELACFSVNCFLKKLRNSLQSKVSFINGYRAVLEWLILDCPLIDLNEQEMEFNLNSKLRHKGLRSIKNAEQLSFWDYANETLSQSVELQKKVMQKKSNSEIVEKINQMLENNNERIILIYTLRQIIAPIIETVIIEDRRTFLIETYNLQNTFILPLFNMFESPRNLALVSFKNIF